MPEEFNLAAFLLDAHLAEGRANKVAVYNEHEGTTYAELAEAANRIGNALLGLGAELENRVMTCRARQAERSRGIRYGHCSGNNYRWEEACEIAEI